MIIIGGGFAGAYIAKKLGGTLISPRDYFEYTPGILRVFGGKAPKLLRVPYTAYGVKHVKGTVTKVDDAYVYLGEKTYRYDQLVVCTGARYRQPVTGGKVYSLYSSKDVIKARSGLNKCKSVAVVGGGLVGTEAAAELRYYYPDLDITVYDKKVCKQLCTKSQKYVLSWFKKHNIAVKAEYVTDTNVHDRYFVCAGVIPNTSFLPAHWLDKKGYVNVDDRLRVRPNVYACGDIISSRAYKTAQNAEAQAEVVVENVKGRITRYTAKQGAIATSLGPRDGTFEYGTFVVTGVLAAMIKSLVERVVLWSYR